MNTLAQVMIDIEPTACAQRDKLERLLAETDIASFNRFGFEAAAGTAPSFAAARQLLDYGPHTIIVTRGGAGVLAVTRMSRPSTLAFKWRWLIRRGLAIHFTRVFGRCHRGCRWRNGCALPVPPPLFPLPPLVARALAHPGGGGGISSYELNFN
ncbi:MAG: hypothetical protein R3A44_07875 [Caldilineaceae bacterium]